jgi:hypothetical protein
MTNPADREAIFSNLVSAFMLDVTSLIPMAMSADVSLVVPGNTKHAGERRGREGVGRFVRGMRGVLETTDAPADFSHAGDHMLATLRVRADVAGTLRDMTLGFRVGFDEDEQITYIVIEPEDVELFDKVILAALSSR